MAENPGSLTIVDVPERCGNAPRKAIVRDFAVAIATRDSAAAIEFLSEDVQWTVNGTHEMAGVDEVRGWLSAEQEARALKIHTVITHGTECGVDGTITTADGTRIEFAHIMKFTGGVRTAKINVVRSYVVPLEG